MTGRRDAAVWLLAAYLAVGATVALSSGLWNAWALGIDGDMQGRWLEYASFRVGDYPNGLVDTPADGRYVQYTVYPPYALPMFAVFFEPRGFAQGRIVVELLSVAALVLMGIFGSDTLVRHGIPWGAVGALAAAAVTVNRSAISLGQFSIVCMGCIVLQIGMLERGRPLAAICAVLRRVLFYHGVYDQIMLFPLLIACLSAALTQPGWQGLATSIAVATTLWVPQRLWEFLPGHAFLQPAIWILATVYVGAVITTPRREDGADVP